MVRSYKNKKWLELAVVALFLLVMPVFFGQNEVFAEDFKVTVNHCWMYEDQGGNLMVNNEQGQEIASGEFKKVCEDNRDESFQKVKVNGKKVCEDAATWNACLNEVNWSGGNPNDIVVATVTDPTIVPSDTNPGTNGGDDGTGDDDSGGGGEEEVDCMNSGGAGTLGWIVCPALNWMTSAVQAIYDTFLEPALQVDPQLFTGGGGATFNGWEFFRNLANALMIILLLVVIFSQVTGVGIDNYGIKKILPKIIIGAILMNLSYWICVAAIDVSNILGNGFQQMFANLTEQVVPSSVAGASVGEALKSTAISVVILTTLAGSAGVIWALKDGMISGLLLLLVVGAITVLVSIISLFIVLAAREAAIVVLVVLSPVAMACYILPNTKGLFDKWVKFFQSLLLVYPIAGLLVGGGNYVSALLLGAGMANDWFGAVTAMIAGIIPIFFIPTVLRRSLAVAGDLGNKISGVGRNVGRRTSGAVDKGVRGSEAFKQRQQVAAQKRIDSYAARKADRLDNKMNRRTSAADRAAIATLEVKEGNGTITDAEQVTLNSLRRKRVNTLSKDERAMLRQSRDNLRAQDHRERENANVADNAFYWAQMRKQRQEDRAAREDQMLYRIEDYELGKENKMDHDRYAMVGQTTNWADARYVQGQDTKTDIANEDDLKKTRMYANGDFVEGTKKQQKLQRDEAYKNTTLYNEPGVVAAEIQKGENARAMKSGEAIVGVRPVSKAESEKLFRIQRNTQMVKDFQSRLQTGGINEDGTTGYGGTAVNGNDMSSVGRFYAQAIERYNNASTQEQRDTAMTQIHAAQNILSQNDKGRTEISNTLTKSVTDAYNKGVAAGGIGTPAGDAAAEKAAAGARMAAGHLQTNYAETLKQKDRGTAKMVEELSANEKLATINGKAVAGSTAAGRYSTFGVEKYSPQALVNADDRVIDRFNANVATMSTSDKAVLKNTINSAFASQSKGTLQMKPEVATKLTTLLSKL